jgi:ABC-type transport system involved in multi-copper enzyme maturation permease subunit
MQSKMLNQFHHEWRLFSREKQIWVMFVLFFALAVYAVQNGRERVEREQKATMQDGAKRRAFLDSLEQVAKKESAKLDSLKLPLEPPSWGARHPYFANFRAASYATLPVSTLAALSIGQSDLHAHALLIRLDSEREVFDHDESDLKNPLKMKIGEFDFAFVIIYLLPLLVLALSFNLISSEREAGILSLILSQPIALGEIVRVKILLRALILLGFAELVVVIAFVQSGALAEGHWARLLLLMLAVALYGLFWFSFAVFVSALGKSSAVNALILAACWLMIVVVIPSVLNGVANVVYPLPSRVSYVNAMRQAGEDAERRSAYQEKLSRNGPVALGIATTDTTMQGIYGAAEYLNRTTVEGNPLNVYARLETTLSKTFSEWSFKTLIGSEWRTDANSGSGRQFDLTTPPRQNYNVGDRPRAYDDIPALHQLSFYLEERLSGKLFTRNMLAQLGVRYDNVSPTSLFTGKFGTVLAPRLNVAIEPVEKIWVRAGYGVTAKAPPLGYLYPNPRFFDLVGLNFFANNPAERLLIVTTRRIEPNTASLRAAENRKVEMGVDWSASFVNLSVTAFDEVTTGGFALARQVVPLTFPVFRVTQTNPGAPPAFAFDSTGKFLGQYDAPVNTRRIENQGVELTADFAEWKPIRTSLNLNLAWIYSRSTSDERFINTDALLSASARGRVGIFNAGNGSERRRLVTSLRLIHRAPQVGLVVSFLAQTIWIDRDQPVGLSNFPIGFLDIDGNQTLLTEEQARSEEFADLRRGLNDVVFREENPPALWLFNIRVTKELSELLQVSFYANNALADRPLYAVNRNANPTRLIFQRRNPVLFFGAEIVLTL